jgi:hypothetical protein
VAIAAVDGLKLSTSSERRLDELMKSALNQEDGRAEILRHFMAAGRPAGGGGGGGGGRIA